MAKNSLMQQLSRLPVSARDGFTMVEVLIAGVIMLIVMVGTARISIQSITSGRHRIERDKIEAAIHNNIQLIQQADSKLTLESMPSQDQRAACLNPAAYLKQQLSKKGGSIAVPEPEISGVSKNNLIERSITVGEHPGITVISYQFSAPEYSIENERRTIELNPNFQTRCILEE
ncbi:prepilin-type N-terminal cleavage/methylation domain-containing protein [Synechococcus sp. UW179A]|uniref:type IV pilus modification PilV family protein n=1 Tax=Synechococcus sp. UW179A TaxID=2575510 RepID=UPI000E0EAF22|nr:prepilin-type N-terminal cleavage/methylation domain-containing protein [Synechococcus sp. UW179A]